MKIIGVYFHWQEVSKECILNWKMGRIRKYFQGMEVCLSREGCDLSGLVICPTGEKIISKNMFEKLVVAKERNIPVFLLDQDIKNVVKLVLKKCQGPDDSYYAYITEIKAIPNFLAGAGVDGVGAPLSGMELII